MSNKLEDFRLQDYNERTAMQYALTFLRSYRPEIYSKPVADLLDRLAGTQCQPGGCHMCNSDYEEFIE